MDWALAEKNRELLHFFKVLIAFRKDHPNLRRTQFKVETINGIPEMTWHGTRLTKPDWSSEQCKTLGLYLAENTKKDHEDCDIYIIINGDEKSNKFELPHLTHNKKWALVFDTAQSTVQVVKNPSTPIKDQSKYSLSHHSIAVFISVTL